ncbi:MAG: hypothetical protein HW380_1974 [Magnetococcales bacterium]|nr:hypothetical protein [Magnetococcales bacterium]
MGSAWADRRHHSHFSVEFESYWGPRYYRPYYYSPVIIERPAPQVIIERPAPQVYVERPAPQVYVERQPAPASASVVEEPVDYWYYCAASKGYYPYVKKCSSAWKKVPMRPAGEP